MSSETHARNMGVEGPRKPWAFDAHARNMGVEGPRFPGEGSSTQGKSGPKPRTEVVGDGQQVEIPAPLTLV